MLLNPTFPAAGLDRLRGQRLVALTQARSQPNAIAGRVFPRIVFGSTHPYGRVVTEESLKAITRDDIVGFHRAYYQPGRALITVVGDTTAAAAKPVIEKALAGWSKAGERPAFNYPAVADPRPTTIFLVDKPGAAQSTFAIGRPGPPRNTPDYYALQVMNTILGGMYRGMIEGAEWAKEGTYLREKIKQYQLDKITGHGRIWRLTYDGIARDQTRPRMVSALTIPTDGRMEELCSAR